MNNFKFAVAGILLAAAVIGLVVQNQTSAKLRAENELLKLKLAQLDRLQSDNEHLGNLLNEANASEDGQTQELLKLRNEVAMLHKQSGEIADLQRKNEQLNTALTSSRAALLAKPPVEAAPKTTAPANGPDLGAVQLVNQTPAQFDLGNGKTCTLTPTIGADGNYDIKVLFESQKPDGASERHTAEIITTPGRAVRIAVGDTSIGFTPTVSPAP